MTDFGHLATYILIFVALFFEVFLLVSFLERRMKNKTRTMASKNEQALPNVAIVVPCWNEERTIAGTLASLLALSYPREKLELIVVDDGSTDNTAKIAKEFTHGTRVRVFQKKNGGKHTAMNLALSKTEAELIGCLDADSIVAPGALAAIIPVFENMQVAAVTPAIHVREPRTLLEHIQAVEYRLSIFNRFVFSNLGSVFITPGPFSIFRTRVLKELGGWRHGHSTEDMELALRIQAAGYLIANAPAASVYTATPRTLKTLFRQRVRWTYGFLRNAFDHRAMLLNRGYGNLGLIILPTALISITAALYFYAQIILHGMDRLVHAYTRAQILGITFPPSFDMFYFNTSALLFLVYVSILLVVVLISIGSLISTGRKMPPASTPLFIALYGFLVPLWLGTAVIRALFRMGVPWK